MDADTTDVTDVTGKGGHLAFAVLSMHAVYDSLNTTQSSTISKAAVMMPQQQNMELTICAFANNLYNFILGGQ